MINRLNTLLGTYQNMSADLSRKYCSGIGEYGELGYTSYVSVIRNTFLSRTRSAFRVVRRSSGLAVAYNEIRTLLNHPVAQELEMMSETARKES